MALEVSSVLGHAECDRRVGWVTEICEHRHKAQEESVGGSLQQGIRGMESSPVEQEEHFSSLGWR